jgi:cysteine desulfurase
MPAPLYLDYQATTPLDPAVLDAMLPYLTGKFGNPHSEHRYGWEAAAGIAVARKQVAALVGAAPDEVIFTSGATEANNLALRGVMEAAPPQRRRLITVVTEHACVLETALDLEARGFELTLLPVQRDGLLDLARLEAALADDVALVSVMAVNNEIGVIQPIAAIAALAKRVGALLHCDAAQAAGKIPVAMALSGIDLMSLSAHKLYGPKGIGALVRRSGVTLRAQQSGGGQEAGVRSGTLAPALCVGFGAAAALAATRLDADAAHVDALWQRLLDHLHAADIEVSLNGAAQPRYKGNLNLSFPGCNGARLLADLRGLALSSGAACASASGKASYVLDAIGQSETAALRIGFGRATSQADVDHAAAAIIQAVRAQRTMA